MFLRHQKKYIEINETQAKYFAELIDKKKPIPLGYERLIPGMCEIVATLPSEAELSTCDVVYQNKQLYGPKDEIDTITYGDKLVPVKEYIRLWDREQEEMKKETPEEKAFRNYRCKFAWYYLLQVGYTNFFGSEDWKRMQPYDVFKLFDKLIWEREPEKMRERTEEMEKYFTENPNEIWIDRKVFIKFLPKSTFQPIVQSMSSL